MQWAFNRHCVHVATLGVIIIWLNRCRHRQIYVYTFIYLCYSQCNSFESTSVSLWFFAWAGIDRVDTFCQYERMDFVARAWITTWSCNRASVDFVLTLAASSFSLLNSMCFPRFQILRKNQLFLTKKMNGCNESYTWFCNGAMSQFDVL